ncbi:glycosyltransferase [Yokenella regensburgei]|uniref:PGL/p-HBAD biosynthesis glycosyltransferase Rv2957/MT3031 n=1 Tax=Yokenella regensburgei TaxID=158877 RepID=A0AB38FZ76_9ENTR|nr:glycosyltransferase [Yokenella regensburgei]EHN8908301.1 glycosyltransferase [Enterobacter hormaechei]KFD23059.1 beta-1,3-glucosyltransferase [Yokenella regensburgei ATCC 49455]SQA64685.1 PGL/p-HBAD biosynthesis glycosyltransferase Rv2957/MT3031 [Yokenella regensburgei]SQA95689.1 PGL/p-HBAD biosynthesis glycosyltransferase Rv2957/MT3031 [Yokenella regensburgei]SUQ03813.1 PGL/p-HBAD biosynthesis glycosyltransferase Rv2957/MT3031 [Yokenella regensburgei]
MKPEIDVSVIIPAFNAQATISHLLHKLLSEQMLSMEVIVVDDGSTDETWTILSAITDERLMLIHQENQGVYAARNAALAVHGGEWVVFLDADDQIADGFLQKRLQAAREAQADVAVFNGWRADSTGHQCAPVHHKQPYDQSLTGKQWIRHCVKQQEWQHYLWLQLTRSAYIREHNLRFQEGKSHKDILWTLHLAAGNGRFYFSDRQDYTYISNPASITHRPDYYDIRAASYIDVITDILALSKQQQHYETRRALVRHALVECRHFLGLYRRKVSHQPALRISFCTRIAFRQLLPGISSLSDVFFLLKLVRKIYFSAVVSKAQG